MLCACSVAQVQWVLKCTNLWITNCKWGWNFVTQPCPLFQIPADNEATTSKENGSRMQIFQLQIVKGVLLVWVSKFSYITQKNNKIWCLTCNKEKYHPPLVSKLKASSHFTAYSIYSIVTRRIKFVRHAVKASGVATVETNSHTRCHKYVLSAGTNTRSHSLWPKVDF